MKYLLLAASLAASVSAFAQQTGFVTPAETTITFTSLSLLKSDNKQITLTSGSFPTVFRKSDSDFVSVPLTSITVPSGRYIGVNICYNTDRTVKLNGDRYDGTNGTGFNSGDYISTQSASSAITGGSVHKTTSGDTTGVALAGYVIGSGSNNCSSSYFGNPVCVASSASSCSSGDTFVSAGTTPPNLNILLDLYHSVAVNANTQTLDNHVPVYPYPTIGSPGAAIHLSTGSGSDIGDISMLFGADKKLLYSAGWGQGLSASTGMCTGGGNGFVTATAGPAGAFINSYGPTSVQLYDEPSAGVGRVQFVSGGNCNGGSGTTSCSSGMQYVVNVKTAAGATTTFGCEADTSAVPSQLGYTYTAAASPSVVSVTATVKRIVDPNNIFGQCTGTCGSY